MIFPGNHSNQPARFNNPRESPQHNFSSYPCRRSNPCHVCPSIPSVECVGHSRNANYAALEERIAARTWASTAILRQSQQLEGKPVMISDAEFSAEIPFSFIYGGKPSAQFLPSWKRSVKKESVTGGKEQHIITWLDPARGSESNAKSRSMRTIRPSSGSCLARIPDPQIRRLSRRSCRWIWLSLRCTAMTSSFTTSTPTTPLKNSC